MREGVMANPVVAPDLGERDVIPGGEEAHHGEAVVGALGLLQRHDVHVGVDRPRDDRLRPRTDGVHVPRGHRIIGPP